MNQKSNPFQPSSKPTQKSHANFIEALKSIGGSTVKSASQDVVGGVSRDFIQSLTNSHHSASETNRPNEWGMDPETRIREEIMRRERQREVQETRVFDRKEEEAKMRIKVVQEELKALAADLAGVDVQIEKAITEEIIHPGSYHESFFTKLRRMIIDLRKRVMDSSVWLEMASRRKAAKLGYWGNVQKSGTKYMLSQERYMATQAG